jgi:hypothetical protein
MLLLLYMRSATQGRLQCMQQYGSACNDVWLSLACMAYTAESSCLHISLCSYSIPVQPICGQHTSLLCAHSSVAAPVACCELRLCCTDIRPAASYITQQQNVAEASYRDTDAVP